MNENKQARYLKYAIGEIVLVVIGILIALQINNWNDNTKLRRTEIYVLGEILNNLEEDGLILEEIILRRQRAKKSIERMMEYLPNDTIEKAQLESDLMHFLNFERYFPINHAYEILKSKGLEIKNNQLTTQLSRYYDFEQKRINRSIEDIETGIVKILRDQEGMMKYVTAISLNNYVTVSDQNNPELKEQLMRSLIGFKENNGGTLEKLKGFLVVHAELKKTLEKEIDRLNG